VILKSVELFGFKSFPEKTRLEFENGISAILGPNGCGKSNIVDAIRWVIGEQSTKALRAGRMEEVIFNGSEDRRQLNIAEVTLTLTNDDGLLPLDLPEISIRRRLYRSGESEYFINRRTARLKQIRELFFDTGIGKTAYSVMEQGKIDQVLSSKPEEKRTIFEEAAGITRYKIRAQEAERKLTRTQENMRQVEAILSEVRRSYHSLKIQAEKTEHYRSIRDAIFELERDIQLLSLKDLLQKKDAKESRLEKAGRSREKTQKQIDSVNRRMEECIDQINRMESELIEGQKKAYGIDLERNNRESQARILRERAAELEKKIRDDELQREKAQEKLRSLNENRGHARSSSKQLEQEIGVVRANIQNFEKDIGLFTEKTAQNDNQISTNESRIAELEKAADELRLKLRRITDDIVTQLDRRLKEMGYSFPERRRLEEEIQELLDALMIQVEGKKALLDDVAKIAGDQKQEIIKVVRATEGLLKESLNKLSRLSELFGRYKSSMPSFIDEFLSPQGIITQKREIDYALGGIRDKIVSKRKENDSMKRENRSLGAKIEEYRQTLEDLRVNSATLDTKKANLQEAIKRLEGEIREQESVLQRYGKDVEEAKSRIASTQKRIGALEEEREELNRNEKQLHQVIAKLEADISELNQHLLTEEKQLKDLTDKLLGIQAQVENSHVEVAELSADIKNIYLNFNEKHGRDLSELEPRMFDIKTPQKDLRAQLAVKREELRNLGHVNLMAPEEFIEVRERHDFLRSQLEDLQKAKTDLVRVTDEIRSESEDLFLEAFGQIRKNFHLMFRRLFGGGRAELRLSDPHKVLESGIEILAQPPGKKLENIDLLSGGERALTGVALLFSVYLTKPSPFCVLDEIDAALDDENIGRFAGLLQEFARETQFLIITHNKRTIASASSLVGITMEESGVSKIITARLRENQN
jgi:chromosome segregation protein